MTVIGGMLAGACRARRIAQINAFVDQLGHPDSIDDMDVMRAGATGDLFAVRAPSTLGTCLRSFSFGDVRSLDAVSRELLVRAWAVGTGPGPGADVTIDLDSTIC